MSLKNTADTWGPVSRGFHWLIVLLLLVQGAMGLLLDDLPKGSAAFHKSLGITILALAVLRILWLLVAGRPGPVVGVTPLQHRLAQAGHWLLYVLLFATPITGWLMSDYTGRPIRWFGLFAMPHLVAPDRAAHEIMEGRHEQVFWILVFVAACHAAMAIHHHVFKRDATLVRMLPRLRNPQA